MTSPLSHGRFLAFSFFLLFLVIPVADGEQLAIASWDGQTESVFAPLIKECGFVTSNQDVVVLLLPDDFENPADCDLSIITLEPVSMEGNYYLYLLTDPAKADIAGASRILWRGGNTVLFWTSETTPALTSASKTHQDGFRQLTLLEAEPHTWPVTVESAGEEVRETDFHPLIEQFIGEVSSEQYVANWQTLDDFETRFYNTSENSAANQWLYDQFVDYGWDVSFHNYSHNGTRQNVVATLPGLVEPDKVVYLTSHMDSISEDPQNQAPGADDNASTTAALLEAARILGQYSFQYTIKLIPFNSEEQGLVGSGAYVADIPASEDVICCLNFDMIAYAGNDGGLPDLKVFANTASLPFAYLIEDVVNTYLSNYLEPVVIHQSMSSSDHGSFWNHGYQAICGSEAGPGDPDLSPWYHTSNDRIENYPQDFPVYITQAAIGALAQTASPMAPDTPYLTLTEITIDDDMSGSSTGNGNGIIEYGETIELYLTLENLGLSEAPSVSGSLEINDEWITLGTAGAGFGDIPVDGSRQNSTPFIFSVGEMTPDNHEFDVALTISEDPGQLSFPLAVAAPQVQVIAYGVDDTSGGDGDGIPEAGESVEMMLTLQNNGQSAVENLSLLPSGGAYLLIEASPVYIGTLSAGEQLTTGPVIVSISASAPELFTSQITLTFDNGAFYHRQESFTFNIGDVMAANFEDGAAGWTHTTGSGGYSDQWHLEDYRNHTVGGTTSWKCGGAGAGNYANSLHAVLESSPFILPAESELTFWHWIDAEISGSYPGYCYDGGRVEISCDGGEWEVLTPAGGYPYLVRDGSNPFPGETPLYSGAHGWQEASFDLIGYAGSARIRFAFGSDSGVTAEGWYVDDVELILSGLSDTDDQRGPVELSFRASSSNPVHGRVTLRLDLPQTQQAQIGIFDASGRCVRMLIDEEMTSGFHNLFWNGKTDSGITAGSGVYWARARLSQENITRRLVVLR